MPGNQPAGSIRGDGRAAHDTGSGAMPPRARPRSIHRSFLERHETPPFYKTREGRQVLMLVAGLTMVGLIALRNQSNRAPAALEKAFANAQIPPTPGEIAEHERKLEEHRRSTSVLFEGALNDSQNGTDFAETAGYLRLLDKVSAYEPEDVAAKITGLLKPDSVMKEPELYRGEFARVRGVVAGLATVKLDVPSTGHITEIFRGVVAQPDGETGAVVFDLVANPIKFELQRTVVDVEGVLYRTVRYTSKTGREREVPWMIARSMRIADLPPTGIASVLTGKSTWILPILGLAAVGFWFYLRRAARNSHRRDPNRSKAVGFHEMFQERLREEQSRKDSTSSGSSP